MRMPTNDERREVAETLRSGVGTTDHMSDDDFIYWVHGVVSRSHDGHILDRLADFIEPEPERTCRIVMASPGEWECDPCGGGIDWDSYDEGDPPNCNYCPNCGAKAMAE